jgi:hypothetical protein
LRRALVYRDLEQQFLRSFIGTSALNAFKVSDLALQNFDLAGIRIDAADLHPSFGFQSFQELQEADEIRIAVHTRHVAIIFCYRRAKSSFSLETRSTLRIAQQSHALGRLSIVAWESTGRGLLDPCAAGPRDSVLSPILIHDDATGRIEARPVVHQTMKDRVSVRNGRPADPERIAHAGLPLARGLGYCSGTQKCHGESGCY